MSKEQLEHSRMLAALRNSFQSAVESIDAYLNFLGQQHVTREHSPVWDPDKVKWIHAEGFRGSYQRYPSEGQKAEATENYKALLADLKAHDGRLTRDGWFYWVFSQDQATIGRKKRKKQNNQGQPDAHSRIGKAVENVKHAGQKLTKEAG